MSGREARDYSVPGTFSAAAALGRAVGDAADSVAAAKEVLGASQLFRGRVVGLSEEEHPGFYVTSVLLAGDGADQDRGARLPRQERDDGALHRREPAGHVPRPGLMLEPRTGRGLMSVELVVGLDVVLLGAPAHPRLGPRRPSRPRVVRRFLSGSLWPARPRVPPDRGAGPVTHLSLIASPADRFNGGAVAPRRP